MTTLANAHLPTPEPLVDSQEKRDDTFVGQAVGGLLYSSGADMTDYMVLVNDELCLDRSIKENALHTSPDHSGCNLNGMRCAFWVCDNVYVCKACPTNVHVCRPDMCHTGMADTRSGCESIVCAVSGNRMTSEAGPGTHNAIPYGLLHPSVLGGSRPRQNKKDVLRVALLISKWTDSQNPPVAEPPPPPPPRSRKRVASLQITPECTEGHKPPFGGKKPKAPRLATRPAIITDVVSHEKENIPTVARPRVVYESVPAAKSPHVPVKPSRRKTVPVVEPRTCQTETSGKIMVAVSGGSSVEDVEAMLSTWLCRATWGRFMDERLSRTHREAAVAIGDALRVGHVESVQALFHCQVLTIHTSLGVDPQQAREPSCETIQSLARCAKGFWEEYCRMERTQRLPFPVFVYEILSAICAHSRLGRTAFTARIPDVTMPPVDAIAGFKFAKAVGASDRVMLFLSTLNDRKDGTFDKLVMIGNQRF